MDRYGPFDTMAFITVSIIFLSVLDSYEIEAYGREKGLLIGFLAFGKVLRR